MAAWAEQPRKRPSRVSQSGKILACLERGGWWTTSELLREVPSIVHSRIHELRDRYGLEIEHRTTGPGASGSEYRLAVLDADESAPLTSGSVPPMGSSASSAAASADPEPVAAGSPGGWDGAIEAHDRGASRTAALGFQLALPVYDQWAGRGFVTRDDWLRARNRRRRAVDGGGW